MIEWKNENLDFFIDSVLRAGGSALKHYSMESSISSMRTAMLNAAMNIESAVSERCAERIESLTAERDALAARVAELERDAGRYRWLRDVSVPPHNFYISVPVEFEGVRYTPQEVDAAIDAAREAAAAKGAAA